MARLREAELLYRILFNQSPYGIMIIDIKTSAVVEFNDAACTQLGYTRDEFEGIHVSDFEAAETAEETKRHAAKVLSQGGDEFNTKYRTKHGEIRDYHVLGKMIEISGKKYLLSIHRDITEQLRTERLIKKERDRAQKYLDIADVILLAIDTQQRVTLINRKGCEILGYAENEIIGKNWFDNFIPQRLRAEVKAVFNRIIAGEISPSKYSVNPVLTRDDERTISWNNTTITDKQGKIVGTLSSGEDITERERWEEELKLSMQLLDSTTDSIFLHDLDGNLIFVNETAYKSHGYTKEEFLSKNLSQLDTTEHAALFKSRMKELIEKGTLSFEVVHYHKNGSLIQCEVHDRIIESGGRKLVLGVIIDITERKKIEQSLKENEERYRSLIELSPDAIFIQSEGKIVFINNSGVTLFGADSSEQLLGESVISLVHPDYRQVVKERISKAIEKGAVLPTLEEKYLRLDGTAIDVEVKSVGFIYQGKPAAQVIIRDITERKRAEQILTDEATRRRILIEQSRDGIVVLDHDGKVYEANQRFAEMLGYSPEEVRNLHVWDWEFQYPREQVQEMLRSVDETGDQFETRHRRKDGTTYDVSISTNGAVFSGQKLVFCVCRNITDQKRAEEELKLRAQLLDNATDSIFLHDFNGNLIYVNETMCKSHGYSRKELTNMKLADIISPEHSAFLEHRYQELVEKGRDKFESEHLRKNGSIMPVEIHSSLIELEHRRLILTVARDISERKQAEEELKLRAQLLDNATDFIFLRDLDGNYAYVNETALKALGCSREEFIKLKDDQSTVSGYTWVKGSLIEELKTKDTVTFETFSKCKDGSTIPVESRARLIESGDKKFILSTVRDITERKKFEETIRQLAYHDPLTGLPNRTLFNDHVNLALAHATRHNSRFAILMMDLDKFKEINDALGHNIGDELLKEVSRRLESAVRKTDTVSRIGGDEFILLLSELANEDDTANVAQKILEAIKGPFMLYENEINITTSIGIAVYPDDGKDIDILTRHADFAMYSIKRGGRNGYRRYTPDMDSKASRSRPSAPLTTKQETKKPDT